MSFRLNYANLNDMHKCLIVTELHNVICQLLTRSTVETYVDRSCIVVYACFVVEVVCSIVALNVSH